MGYLFSSCKPKTDNQLNSPKVSSNARYNSDINKEDDPSNKRSYLTPYNKDNRADNYNSKDDDYKYI